MPIDGIEPYQVVFPGPILQQVRQWAELAHSRRFANIFAVQLRRVVERLSTDPLGWGERRGTLHGRNLPVHHGAVPLFHIEYAVDAQARAVFVVAVQPMPNSPLTGS